MAEFKKIHAHFQRYLRIEVYRVSSLQLSAQHLEEKTARQRRARKALKGLKAGQWFLQTQFPTIHLHTRRHGQLNK